MKKNIFGLLMVASITGLLLSSGFSGSRLAPLFNAKEGINFEVTSLAKAQEIAKAENKPLFVFAHATWCSTCKKMEKEVLIRKELGDAYNQAFLNVAIDIDSKDGKQLKDIYPIRATPTLFFFNADGSIAKKIEGFATTEDLMAVVNQMKN